VVWWVIPTFWLPIIGFFLWRHAPAIALSRALTLFPLGMLYWTFVEYTLHRFVFHLDERTPNWAPTLALHFLLHGVHHKVPNDRYRLVFPPAPAVILCVIVGYLSRLWSKPFIPDLDGFAVFYSGMVFGYILYDLMHYAFHHGNWSPNSYMGRMRKYHLRHHYNNQYNVGFGITSPLWDYVFGTRLTID
jgi:4-hydroxysphinganine ceramide fatty acyl 2-hydroxylase